MPASHSSVTVSNSRISPVFEEKPKIAALIPRGEVIRNFVYTGAFEEIIKQANLALLTVETNSAIDEDLRRNFGEIYPLADYEERWLVRFQREILENAHNRQLWSEAAQERSRLRKLEAVSLRQKAARLFKIAVSRPLANETGLKILSKIERTSSRILRTTDEYIRLFENLKPALVFNGSHVHSRIAVQAVQAANWLKIPTATFIFSWDNLTSQGRILLPYDYFLVWNEALKNQLLQIYRQIRPEQVFVTGTPQFDFHFRTEFYQSREQFCREIGADSQRALVLYTTGMANHMPGEPEIVEEIADMLKEINTENPPQLLVRIYPKDSSGRFEDLKRRRPDILFPEIAWEPAWQTPKYEDCYALTNVLRHCACGINVASTVSLELCMFDKPVVNVGYNPPNVPENILSYAGYYNFDHYRPVVESGAVEVARSPAEMRLMLKKSLAEPQRRTRQRSALIRKMFGETLDGDSAKRVAATLLEIASKNSLSSRK